MLIITGMWGIINSVLQLINPISEHYSFINLLLITYNINSNLVSIFKILFYLTFLVTGYLLFKLHPVSRYLIKILSGICLFILLYRWGTVGLVEHNLFYYITLLISILSIAVIDKSFFSKYINCNKRLNVLQNIIFVLFFITLLVYIISIILINKDSPKFTKSNFKNTSFSDEFDVVTFDFPPNYSIDIPIDKIKISYLLDFENQSIGFIMPKDSLYLILYQNSLSHKIYDEVFQDSTINEYDFTYKFLSEKFGYTYLGLNDKWFNISKTSNYMRFRVNSLNVIASLKSSNYGDYSIFQNNEIGSISLVNLKKDIELPISDLANVNLTINNFISSLKPINKTTISAEDYYHQGLAFYNQSKYREASLKFISSLLINNENANCKFHLIKSIINSDDFVDQEEFLKWIIVEKILKDLIKQDPDNVEAKSLYLKACDINTNKRNQNDL